MSKSDVICPKHLRIVSCGPLKVLWIRTCLRSKRLALAPEHKIRSLRPPNGFDRLPRWSLLIPARDPNATR
jgi:hypothetical protein